MLERLVAPLGLVSGAWGAQRTDVALTQRNDGRKASTSMSQSVSGMPGQGQGEETQAALEAKLASAYVEFSGAIHSYAFHMLGNREDADDVVQEVFIRAQGHLSDLREQAHLKSWLYRIATNLCMDQLRRRTRIRRHFGFALSLGAAPDDDDHAQTMDVANPASAGALDGVAEREHIVAALRRMPPKYAACLVLHSAQGLSYREIAQALDITPGAAAVRLTRARDLFAKYYDALRGEEPR